MLGRNEGVVMKGHNTNHNGHESGSHPLAMRPQAAARALGISERLLWDWTRTEGLPHVRIGNVVLYPVACLQSWLLSRAEAAAPGADLPAADGSTRSAAVG